MGAHAINKITTNTCQYAKLGERGRGIGHEAFIQLAKLIQLIKKHIRMTGANNTHVHVQR